ncbi:hypothetical protein OGH69_17565 [Flavobacterium sp. MFBS3-15]|uniref:hypothetical protein n=1 Tax=Flavobacterium sp. MFBS3-15 TaxID=2989816 RepID=UPI0022363F95|nr:hypothetical protein [Flavobacterium sp. MFBS3-15]MCW4470785.1 hypothetical protein [Flavobacterium sp. MFBS3-15]
MKDTQSLLIRITCLFWIITKLFSYKAWFADGRLYPVVSPFEFLDAVPPIVHAMLFAMSLSGLLLIMAYPRKTFLLAISLVTILLSCLLDVLRWQPWEYQFLFFLLVFILNRKNPAAMYSAIIFIMGCIYIYSGLHKFNGGFLYSVWENMILKGLFRMSGATIAEWKLHYPGLALPLIETLGGVALLTFRNKSMPIFLLIAMHVLIILMLCGVGISYNRIVLPWNVAMILFLVVFYRNQNTPFSIHLLLKGPNMAFILFWGLLPALSFAGYWEKKLSSSLYSGTTKFMDICIQNPEAVPQLQNYFNNPSRNCDGNSRLKLQNWCSGETHLLPYSEIWYYRKFKKKWEKMYPGADATFKVYQYPYKKVAEIE